MQDIDRLIDTIVPEYENSAYEYEALFTIAKAAVIDDIAKNKKDNPNYNIFVDHNPTWLIRTAINKFIEISNYAFDKYPAEATNIQRLMLYNARVTTGKENIQPPFDISELDRISNLYREVEADYEDNLHDVYRELGDNIRTLAHIYARNYAEHSEDDYFNAGMTALHKLSQKYSEEDIMRHKPEAYICQQMQELARKPKNSTPAQLW